MQRLMESTVAVAMITLSAKMTSLSRSQMVRKKTYFGTTPHDTSCNTQPVTFKQQDINDDIEVSTVNANNLIGFSLNKFAPGND